MNLENTRTMRDLLRNAGQEYADRTFLRFEYDNSIYDTTYPDFIAGCEAVGAWAENEAEKEGHQLHIAAFGAPSQAFLTAIFGAMISGNVTVPLDVQLGIEQLTDTLKRADVDAVFYDTEHADLVLTACEKAGVKLTFMLQADRGHYASLGDIYADYMGKKCESEIDEKSLAMILFTSGTTGKSKGVMLSHLNLIDNTFCSDDTIGKGLDAYAPNNILSVLPLHHVFCLNSDVFLALKHGWTICLNGDLKLIVKHLTLFNPVRMCAVPAISKALMNRIKLAEEQDPDRPSEEIVKSVLGEKLVRITSGGGYLPPELAEEFRKRGIEIGQGYGMSECSPKISVPDYDRPDKAASIGKPVDRCEVKIVDGEILAKSPSVMMGYYNDPEETKNTLDEDGWLHTGDLGYIDDEGFLFLTGRKKNLIILSNGENVAPESIENMFAGVQLVQEIVVYGSGDIIAAEIYPNFPWARERGIKDINKALNKEIKKINEGLASYQRIMQVRMRQKPFPKTSSNKISRIKYFEERENEKETLQKMHLPESDLQQTIYDCVASAIGHRKFGIDMNLFECGLDSMGSVMLLSDLFDKMNFQLTLAELMDNATVRKLEALYWEKENTTPVDYSKREVYDLISLQLYFAYMIRGNSTGNMPFLFKIGNNVDLRRLKYAAEQVFEVHPELKCIIQPGKDGILQNFRDDERHIEIPIITISDKGWESEKKKVLRYFNYQEGEDLFHSAIYQTDSANYFLFDICHAIGDGTAMRMLFDDINDIYCGKNLPREEYTFYEYIIDWHEMFKNGTIAKNQHYFKELAEGYKYKRNALTRVDEYDLEHGHNAVIRKPFSSITRDNVLGFCKKTGASENIFFLTAFQYCIKIFTNQTDVVATSIHSGRVDSRWNRISGPVFKNYLYRYDVIPHETVPELLKRMSTQIMDTMKSLADTLHYGEFFIQYQGDLLQVDTIGDAPAEIQHVQLDSLPFHLMIHQIGQGYVYEVRYWENRFDKTQVEIFMAAMESVMLAMFTEPSVRRLERHLPEHLYPKHSYVTGEKLNELAGFELIDKQYEGEKIKVYVLDARYLKKPFGAWGELFIMDTPVKNAKDSVTYPYGDGILYNTGLEARILPDGSLDLLENSGRIILWESPTGTIFPDLKAIEDTLKENEGVESAEAWLEYAEQNTMKIVAEISTSKEVDEEVLKEAVKDKVGEKFIPEIRK